MLGLRCCMQAFSSCRERGLLFNAVRGLLIVVASHCRARTAPGARASVVLACRLSSCGAQACLLCSMWDLPRPGIEPISPALAGGFLTTAPPGKSLPWLADDGLPQVSSHGPLPGCVCALISSYKDTSHKVLD